MQLERRRHLRRALSGGVVLAAVTAIPLALLEIVYVQLVRQPVFGSYGEAIRFGLYLVMLLASVAAVLGAVEGLVILTVSALTKVLAKRRLAEPRWMAWLYSLLALPGIAVVCALAFSGRRAQQIPGKHFIGLGIGLVALGLTYGALRLIIGARDRFRIRRWGPRHAAALVVLTVALGAALYVADQRVLARLYGFFHVVLALGAVACFQLAGGAVYCAYRPRARWMGRLAEPGVALLIFVAGVTGTAWSLHRISQHEAIRFLYHEHTAIQAKVLSLATRLGLSRGPGLPTASAEPPPPLPTPSGVVGPRFPEANIVLLSVDALRADHLGAYGYSRKVSPNLDRWAEHACVVERGYCQVPHTSFSVTSLMTGTYMYSASQLDPGRRYRTMAEVLRRYGFKTGAFFPPAVFYIDRDNFTAFESSKFGFEYVKYEYLDAEKRVDQMIAFLRQEREHRFFVWGHFFEPHEPYVHRAAFDFGSRAVDRYDSEIAYVDHHLGRLLRYIAKHHPNTIVALTADHGEEFGEHGAHYHGNALYDQQVRVPLIIDLPGRDGCRVAGAGQIIDLPVTLISLVDVPLSAGMRGTDLSPWLAGEDPDRLPPAFSELSDEKMVVHRGHKLICNMAESFCQLYDLTEDPDERVNLVGREPRRAAALRRRLSQWMGSHAPRREARDEEAEVAEALDRARQRDPAAIPALVKLAKGELEHRRQAVKLLTHIRAPGAREALVAATGDGDPGVRIQATVGAALLGERDSAARLETILQRPDLPPRLRRDALLAQALAGVRRAARPLARILADSEDIYQRVEIIEALGRLGDRSVVPTLMRQLETLRTRLATIEALGQIGAARAVPVLARGLREDRFISWRRAAARALGNIGVPAARAPLVEAVRRDLEGDVVADALMSLALMKALPVPGVRSLPRGPWRCEGAGCTLRLARRCSASTPRDLMVVWRLDTGDRSIRDPAPPRAADAERPTSWQVLCGDREVGELEIGARGAQVVNIPAGQSGPLRLRAPGTPGPLIYAATRPVPTGAADRPGTSGPD